MGNIFMKNSIRKVFNLFGYDVLKINPFPVGTPQRPVGNVQKLLQDIKARGLICNSILDIGANNGGWSVMAKGIFPTAKFCLIEPQFELEENLKSFVNDSKGSIYFIAGAGFKPEKKYLTIWDDLAGSSFLPKESDTLKENGKQRQIDIITIDDIIKNGKFPIPELVKIDVQGYELEALKGAELLFGKTEVFILECSLFSFSDVPGMPLISDIVNFMLDRDYLIYDFPGFARRPMDGALGQCDVCFVKRNGFLRSSNDWI
jgi:FkbM family methyltransferase